MIQSTPQKQPKLILDKSNTPPPAKTAIHSPVPSHDQIRERAYQLYENRGRETGRAEQDWLRAEQEILKQGQ